MTLPIIAPQGSRIRIVQGSLARQWVRSVGFSYGLALLVLAVFFFAISARWIWVYRHGQPLDIDEAGYFAIALIDYHALVREGLPGWLSAVLAPSIQAPLTTALASLLFYFTGPHVIVGFAVPLLAGTGCVVATYFLGKSAASRQVGLAASILVASCPVVLSYSRSFHFSLPATVVCTVMLLALVKSDRFGRMGWAVLFGVSLGLMPLARTMTIAFIPGVVAGALVYTVAGPIQRGRRLLVLSTSFLLAILTATTWLGPNGSRVYQYLFSFGYGARAVEFGAEAPKFNLDSWLNTLRAFCNNDVYLPHLLVMLAGGVATVIAACNQALKAQNGSFLQRTMRSSMLPILIVVAEALLALASPRNQSGSAFFAPIVPSLLVVTVWGFLAVSSYTYYRRALVFLLAAVAITASVPLIDLNDRFAPPWWAIVPALGGVTVTDGRGTFQDYGAAGGYGSADAAEPISRAMGRAWISLDSKTAATIRRMNGANAVVAFGFRHRLYNVNTVNVQQLLSTGVRFGVQQVEPTVTGDSVQGYLSWLASEGASACVLLTSDKTRGHFPPLVNPLYMREAAEQAGFLPIGQWPAPDEQEITLWQHRVTPPNCGRPMRDSTAGRGLSSRLLKFGGGSADVIPARFSVRRPFSENASAKSRNLSYGQAPHKGGAATPRPAAACC
jgi:Dolichyl-phosphate-mannose-protein mannosyltransferase